MPEQIFICYSSKDAAFRDALMRPLRALPDATTFVDIDIASGTDWRTQIECALREASVGIVLVSNDLLISEFVQGTELPSLFARWADGTLSLFVVHLADSVWEESAPRLGEAQWPLRGRPVVAKMDYAEAERAWSDVARVAFRAAKAAPVVRTWLRSGMTPGHIRRIWKSLAPRLKEPQNTGTVTDLARALATDLVARGIGVDSILRATEVGGKQHVSEGRGETRPELAPLRARDASGSHDESAANSSYVPGALTGTGPDGWTFRLAADGALWPLRDSGSGQAIRQPDVSSADVELRRSLAEAEGALRWRLATAHKGMQSVAVSLEWTAGGIVARVLGESLQASSVGASDAKALARLLKRGLGEEVRFCTEELESRVSRQVDRLKTAAQRINELERERLLQPTGEYLALEVDEVGETGVASAALSALDRAAIARRSVFLTGDYGSGKSTALAEWCFRRDSESPDSGTVHVFVNLGRQSTAASILDAIGESIGFDRSQHAAIKVALLAGRLRPVLDGLDEWSAGGTKPAERLSQALRMANYPDTCVVVSARATYWRDEDALRSTIASVSAELNVPCTHFRMRPLGESEILQHIRRRRPRDSVRFHARVEAQHDLAEMCRRPLLLSMVVGAVGLLPGGGRIAPAEVYEACVRTWLLHEDRKRQPRQLQDDLKVKFAEAAASHFWQLRLTAVNGRDLRRLAISELGHLADHGRIDEAISEAVNSTFFVRTGEDAFAFAHRSFLEFFFARALLERLPTAPGAALDTEPLTAEVRGLVRDLASQAPDHIRARSLATHPAVASVRDWLLKARRAGPARAVTRAVELLRDLAREAGDSAGWIPEGARLDEGEFVGMDLRGVRLRGAVAVGADFRGAEMSGANLEGADLRGADFTGAAAEGAVLTGADCRGATFMASTWTRCFWEGALVAGADATAMACTDLQLSESGGGPAVVVLSRRLYPTNGADWSPDSKKIATGSPGKGVGLWDPDTGRLLLRLGSAHSSHPQWNPQGTQVFSWGRPGDDSGEPSAWNAVTGEPLICFAGRSLVANPIRWSPDGTAVLVSIHHAPGCTEDRLERLGIWSPGGQSKAVLDLDGAFSLSRLAEWSPSGRSIAALNQAGVVAIWKAADGGRISEISGKRPHAPIAIEWIDDDVVTLHYTGGIADRWTGEGRFLGTDMVENAHLVDAWRCNRGRGRADTGSYSDHLVRVTDLRDGSLVAELPVGDISPFPFCWSPDGKRLAVDENSGQQIWNPWRKQRLALLGGGEGGSYGPPPAWCPDGRRFATSHPSGFVRIWCRDRGAPESILRSATRKTGGVLVWSPDRRWLAAVGQPGQLTVWRAGSGRPYIDHQMELDSTTPYASNEWCAAWSPNGEWLAVGSSDGRVWLAEVGAQSVRCGGHRHREGVSSMSWRQDGGQLATGSVDGEVAIWSLPSIDCGSGAFRLGRVIKVLTWSPDGLQMAGASYSGDLVVWRVADRSEVRRLNVDSFRSGFTSLAWHSHGLVAVSNDGRVRLIDTRATANDVLLHPREERSEVIPSVVRTVRLTSRTDGCYAEGWIDDRWCIWEVFEGRVLFTFRGRGGEFNWDLSSPRLLVRDQNGIELWRDESSKPMVVWELSGERWLCRLPTGEVLLDDGDPTAYRLAMTRPDCAAEYYVPLGGYVAEVNRPAQVGETLREGTTPGPPAPAPKLPSWNGRRNVLGVSAWLAGTLDADTSGRAAEGNEQTGGGVK